MSSKELDFSMLTSPQDSLAYVPLYKPVTTRKLTHSGMPCTVHWQICAVRYIFPCNMSEITEVTD